MVLTFFVLMGCQRQVKETKTVSFEAFKASQSQRLSVLKRASLKLKLYLENKNQSLGGKGQWIWSWPDLGRLEIRDGTGRAQLVLVQNKKEFMAHYPTQKVAYYDEQSGALFAQKLFAMSLSMDEWNGLVLGVLPQALLSEKWERLDAKETEIEAYETGRGSKRFLIEFEKKNLRLVRLKSLKAEEQTLVEWSDFFDCCAGGLQTGGVGRNVHVHSSELDQQIDFHIEQLRQTEKVASKGAYTLNIPPQSRKILLK